ncbi:MAG: GntR family transcriptional regulator [Enterococcaceae bacterium]|jgi:GntR family transcriptional regulator|nr:GntR family transcriptional regulator [Enterococcaceae bacterium]MCI1918734.1 GntR family transcriptional regulator [Enterococcaceae bacterium]
MAANTPPIYIQIHDQLKKQIAAGIYKIGDRLPSERELSVQFGVSRMTLRQAVQLLADEGILERKVGSGTYIANKKVQEKMSGVTSFTEIMKAQGKHPSSRTLSYYTTLPSSSEQEELQLAPDETILKMERIRYADNVPICFEVASLPAALVQGFTKHEITTSLYHTLETKGKQEIKHAEQTITAQLASEQTADYLRVKRGDAILKLRQVSYLNNGKPFEYVRTQYAGNRFEFYLEK